MAEPQIVGIGGGGDTPEQSRALFRHVLSLTGKGQPRVLHVPTAVGDSSEGIVSFYERLGGLGELSHLRFFPYPPDGLRDFALSFDAIHVSGGNTANALSVWRTHGFDKVLREAWERDVLLTGYSAGAICWFEASVTDSFGPQLAGMRDGLAFLPGSACPHYDTEELRRPRYAEIVRDGFPAGLAIDDDVGLRFDGTELTEVVASRDGARAYRVSIDGEEPLDARRL